MPYFAQEPVSYLTLPTIRNAYKSFSIKIDFRADNVDGEWSSAGGPPASFHTGSSTLLNVASVGCVSFPHVSCPLASSGTLVVGRSHTVRW